MTDDQTWALRGRAQLLHRPETGGVLRAALYVNGRLAGTWRSRRGGSALRIVVEPFEPMITTGLIAPS